MCFTNKISHKPTTLTSRTAAVGRVQHTGELSGDDPRLKHLLAPVDMLADKLFSGYRTASPQGKEQGPPVDGDQEVPGLAATLLYGGSRAKIRPG